MARGILLVETRPNSPDGLAAYHEWYEQTHIPEMLTIDGIASARRLVSDDGQTFIAVYEIDGIEEARANLRAAQASGAMSQPVGVQLDPPPVVRYFTEIISRRR